MSPEQAMTLLRETFEKEERTGFARLKQIPDTYVWRFPPYYSLLEPAQGEALKNALARRACRLLLGNAPPGTEAEEASLDAFRKNGLHMGEWRFMSLKLLKMAVGYVQSDKPRARAQCAGMTIPPDIIEWVNGMTTCKAATLRKLVKAALQSRFGLKPQNGGGGGWIYGNADGERNLEVEIDYGGTWGQQLRYWVIIDQPSTGRRLRGLNYETILGVGLGDWDFITEENADQSVALLADLIDETATLAHRIFGP